MGVYRTAGPARTAGDDGLHGPRRRHAGRQRRRTPRHSQRLCEQEMPL